MTTQQLRGSRFRESRLQVPIRCSSAHLNSTCYVSGTAAWIGSMYFSLGLKGQSGDMRICTNYLGHQVHMGVLIYLRTTDETH